MSRLLINFYIQSTCENVSGSYDLGSINTNLIGTKLNLSLVEQIQTVEITDRTQWSFLWVKYGTDDNGNIIDPPSTKTLRKPIVNSKSTGCKGCGSTKKSNKDCEITITWKINTYEQ